MIHQQGNQSNLLVMVIINVSHKFYISLCREFFQQLFEDVVKPQHCLFKRTLSGLHKPTEVDSLLSGATVVHYKFMGKLLAKAIMQGNLLIRQLCSSIENFLFVYILGGMVWIWFGWCISV